MTQIVEYIKQKIFQNGNQVVLAALNNKKEASYLIHENGTFYCVGIPMNQEKNPGDFGSLNDLSLKELYDIQNNFLESSAFIADLLEDPSFFNEALPNVNKQNFIYWLENK